MPNTYSQILLHTVFSTKDHASMIKPTIQGRLYEYVGGIVRAEKGLLLAIGGTPDHLHMLVQWRTDEAIADLLRDVKSRSSSWIHKTFPAFRTFAWQEGYGVFSVSKSQEKRLRAYIAGQEEHHRTRDFKEEFLRLLRAHDIDYDEKYLWD